MSLPTVLVQSGGNTTINSLQNGGQNASANCHPVVLPYDTFTNPTSILTRPANTTAYSPNDLVGSNTVNTSLVVPFFSIVNSGGGVIIPRIMLITNATTGWGSVSLQIGIWVSAPTYTNGDNAAYAPATGSLSWKGTYNVFLTQFGDGAVGVASPSVGPAPTIRLASGTSIYWDLQILTAATPISGQTFTVIPEIMN